MLIRVATRRSLLALAQTRQVLAQLASLPASAKFDVELVEIDSAGDQNPHQPLWQLGVVGAFSHALDEALLAGQADLAVHSLKDLGTQRPAGLTVAAVPRRAPQHDVLLLRPHALERLAAGQELVIGSSAPRRQHLLPPVLARLLPHSPERPARVRVTLLRGNVHSRLEQLHHPGPYDGVVLALAGLERLYRDHLGGGHGRVVELLAGLQRMLLPLTACPGAPGQGALALVTRSDDTALISLLQGLHDPLTAAQVEAERAILVAQGGGCHQPFGVSTLETSAGTCRVVRGQNSAGHALDALDWHPQGLQPPFAEWPAVRQALLEGRPLPAEGRHLVWQAPATPTEAIPLAKPCDFSTDSYVFVAHHRAWQHLSPTAQAQFKVARLWVSGVKSWGQLAAQGCWVEGCADGLGFDWLDTLAREATVLGLPQPDSKLFWTVLTHSDAVVRWAARRNQRIVVHASYVQSPLELTADQRAALQQARYIVWRAPNAFDRLRPYLQAHHWHLCGTGATARTLRAAGLKQVVELPLFADFRLFQS